jgi:uncharacterized protein YecT (DUF1311 family)
VKSSKRRGKPDANSDFAGARDCRVGNAINRHICANAQAHGSGSRCYPKRRQCLFNLVATPCTKTREGSSNLGIADCYRVEWVIWDNLLNENFKNLMGALDNQRIAKLRAMQQAWITYRDTTCNFYMEKIQGSMAIPMGAACAARETARRALLLRFFDQI